MRGLVFQDQVPIVGAPNRADIACFVGFCRWRGAAVPPEIQGWLAAQGWLRLAQHGGRLQTAPASDRITVLRDLPIPIETWEVFDRLWAWEQRPLVSGAGDASAATYLGAAVRSFFAQGGRKCYVVAVDAPWPLGASRDQRMSTLGRLLPGYPDAFAFAPGDRASWRGIGHLLGLGDVSFVCLPDLADAVAADQPILTLPREDAPPEQWVECGDTPAEETALHLRAPRCGAEGYADWGRAVQLIARFLRQAQAAPQLREIQLVAALPLPESDLDAARDPLRYLLQDAQTLLASTPDQYGGISSAFVQLAYPWAQTPGSRRLPEALESPDGILTGVLARSALARGSWRSAANQPLGDVQTLYPALSRAQTQVEYPPQPLSARRHTLVDRVSLLAPTPAGLRLISDVTTSALDHYRPAAVNRLVAALVRAARRLGESSAFESSGPLLWAQLRDSLETLLRGLWQAGALNGATAIEAFGVRCDRSTMTQNDLDSGRVVAEVVFAAAVPIEQITVVLAMNEGGQVSLLATEAA